ncbi:hypothetical protein MH216_20920, partial [Paenibacillus larvae]|uniref:hypothetical protein n=1 Tax=Paenibacillus larvae TaxID=1464 RepID=UPI00227E6323
FCFMGHEKMLLLTVNSFIISTVYRKGSISVLPQRLFYIGGTSTHHGLIVIVLSLLHSYQHYIARMK